MDRQSLILGLEQELLIREFIAFATKELGAIKMNDIIRKLNHSGKVAKFLMKVRRLNLRLGSDDYLGCIHSSTSFVLSNSETISVASIALLIKWDHEIGKPNGLSDDIYFNQRFFSILDKCNGFKLHIKGSDNFFERFNNHIEGFYLQCLMNCSNPIKKTEISFNSVLCGAIEKGGKTQFRVTDNLEIININPDDWSLKGYDRNKGAIFLNTHLGGNQIIGCPYELGSYVNVLNSNNTTINYSRIKIKSYYIQRIKDVDQGEAIMEGYGAYSVEVNELMHNDPSQDAEYCLFEDNWRMIHGNGSYTSNEWIWVFEFENVDIIKTRATSAGLSPSDIDFLANIEI